MTTTTDFSEVINKYGAQVCIEAYESHIYKGAGGNTVGWENEALLNCPMAITEGMATKLGNDLIDAGRHLTNQ